MNQAGVRTEKLWFNFTPDRFFWTRYAGKNFTDRQRIKRKASNWARYYQAMPPAGNYSPGPRPQPAPRPLAELEERLTA